MPNSRKLAAIMVLDIVGFSRLVAHREEATLARMRELRDAVFEPAISAHSGRIVKSTGDGLLVDFRSVVDAIRSAIEIQERTSAWNGDIESDQRIELRVGIHLGDIVEEADGDILGDGVNIAARLESIARPGGICISEDAYRQVRSRLDVAVRDLGPQSLKNIPEPLRVFAIGGEPSEDAQPPAITAPPAPKRGPHDKPSLAVLPFDNMSGDREQDYFVDGMADDIITALSRFEELFVISRNSSFAYKGKNVDASKIGEELGVRYILEGSVRRAGDRVRITGQLVATDSGRHLWADRFDGKLDDVFDLQDQITANVVAAIEPTVRRAEIERARARPPQSLDAYDLLLQALPNVSQIDEQANREGLELLMRALEIDPAYGTALAQASWALVQRSTRPWTPYGKSDRALAIEFARRALNVAGGDAHSVVLGGFALTMLREDYLTGLAAVRRAVELNPGSGFVSAIAGCALVFGDEVEAGLEILANAMLLGPKDPDFFRHLLTAGYGHLGRDRYEEALDFASRSLALNPNWDSPYILIIAANSLLGREEEALSAARRLLEIQPQASASHYDQVLPFRNAGLREKITKSLLAAGIPA